MALWKWTDEGRRIHISTCYDDGCRKWISDDLRVTELSLVRRLVNLARGPLTVLVPPAGRWAAAATAGCCSHRGAARRPLPGRPAAARSGGAEGGACPPPGSPLKNNVLCPGRKRPSGSEAPGP